MAIDGYNSSNTGANPSTSINDLVKQDKARRKEDGEFSTTDRIENTKLKIQLLTDALKQTDPTSSDYEKRKKTLARSIEELIRAYDKAITKQEKNQEIPPELKAILEGSSGAEQEQRLAEYLKNNQLSYLGERTALLEDATKTISGLADEIELTGNKLNEKKPLLYKIHNINSEYEEASAKYSSMQSVLENASTSTDLEGDIKKLKLAYASDRKDTIADKLAPVEDKLHPHQCSRYTYSEDGKSRQVSYTDKEEYSSDGKLRSSTYGKSSRIEKNQVKFNELNPLFEEAVNEVKQLQEEIGVDTSVSASSASASKTKFYAELDKAVSKLNSQSKVTTTKLFYDKEAEALEKQIKALEAEQEKEGEKLGENGSSKKYDEITSKVDQLYEELDTRLEANKQKVVTYDKNKLNAGDKNKLLNAYLDAASKTKSTEREALINEIKGKIAFLSKEDAVALVKLFGLESEGLV